MGHIRVDLPNTNNKWVEFELVNIDTFIIRIRFRLVNVDTIRIRLIDTNNRPYLYVRILLHCKYLNKIKIYLKHMESNSSINQLIMLCYFIFKNQKKWSYLFEQQKTLYRYFF